MSGFISEPVRTDQHQDATSSHGNPEYISHSRQTHDRSYKGARTANTVIMNGPREPEVEVDISAGQKMLSAVSGSLLTSLLGSTLFHSNKCTAILG